MKIIITQCKPCRHEDKFIDIIRILLKGYNSMQLVWDHKCELKPDICNPEACG